MRYLNQSVGCIVSQEAKRLVRSVRRTFRAAVFVKRRTHRDRRSLQLLSSVLTARLLVTLLLWHAAVAPFVDAAVRTSRDRSHEAAGVRRRPAYSPASAPAKGSKVSPNHQDLATQAEVVEAAVVRHAPVINGGGRVEGALRQLTGENVTLSGGAAVTAALLVPGTPQIRLNGNPNFGGTVEGSGSTQPSGYSITLNGNVTLGRLVTRTDPIPMPTVAAPPQSPGTRDVVINSPGQNPGDFRTIRDLTLNGNVGDVTVPPGAYRNFTANGNSGFVFGIAGTAQPAVYNLTAMTFNGQSRLRVVGPVVVTLANGMTLNTSMGAASNPLWLALNISAGGVTLNGGSSLYAVVRAPSGSVVLNGNTLLQGSVVCDRLTINGNSTLKGTPGTLDAISLTRATQGQTLSVTMHGQNTHWVQGRTKASFGEEVSTGGAPAGEPGSIQVVDSTTATAQLAVSATAALAPRTVKVITEIGFPDVSTETLIDAFTVVPPSSPGASSSIVSTVAGSSGNPGFADGAASQARFRDLASVAAAPDDTIYVADAGNNRIRKIATDGTVTTIAGDGSAGFADGPGASARFNNPQGVAVDSTGVVCVADTGNNRIRRIATDGTVSTLAGSGPAGLQDGLGTQARFTAPRGLAFDNHGNVYVADSGNSAVRFISAGGNVSTVAGDGTIGSSDSPAARFNGLVGIVFDGRNLYVYAADTSNHRIRRLDPAGNVITIAGADRGFADGPSGAARFADPSAIAVDGGKLIIADATNSLVRLVDPGAAPVSTLAGTGERGLTNGTGAIARFFTPRGVAVERSSAILIADTGNHVVRRITLPPSIASISPSRSRTGEIVVINGERFDGRAPDRNTVRFTRAGGGQTSAQILAAATTSLSVIVPQDAANGPVTVQTGGGTVTSATNFEIISQPVIADFNPKSGLTGTVVTVTGSGLMSTLGNTAVTFSGPGSRLQAVVSFASPTEVRAAVPEGALTGPINVQTEGGTASTAANFQVVLPTPVISDFAPRSGQIGSSVTLTGASLMAGSQSPSVTFAGSGGSRLNALVTSASPASVRVTVPNAAITGVIQLTTAGGAASTPGPFTVQPSQRDYQLTIAPSSSSAVQRTSANYVVYVTSPASTFSELVSLTASGLPAGVSATFNPAQITAGANSTLRVGLADADLAAGSYSFTIRASGLVDGSQLVRSAAATLNVIAAGQTTLSGVVLSTEKEPIIGATVSLDGKTATTDAAGAFLLSGITAGAERPLMVDGRTASAPNRSYPVILEPATIVSGQANIVPYTFYLPPIDTQFEVDLVPGQNTEASNPRVPGLKMTIPAGANLRNRDGSPVARVSITPLAIDRTPAPLPSNVATSLVYTSQPGGAVSDLAIPVSYPNLSGAAPGTRAPLYAFNHDTVQWYIYGYGRVSGNAETIEPEIDPSTGKPYGLRDFSWHFPSVSPDGDPGDPEGCPSNRGDNPVDFSTGMKIEMATDISFGGARGGLELSRVYTTDLAQTCDNCLFGRGANHNYSYRLYRSAVDCGALAASNVVTAMDGGGVVGAPPCFETVYRVATPEQKTGRLFRYSGRIEGSTRIFTTQWTASQVGDELRVASDSAEYRKANGDVMRFDGNGRLIALADRNGNTTTLTYAGSNLTRVTDAVARSITLDYDTAGRIVRATDPIGRIWQYTYELNLLTAVADPLGNITRYEYGIGGRLASVTDPRGNKVKQISYDDRGRVIEQRFADGGIEHYAYTLSGDTVTGVIITDPLGHTISKRFNARGYVIEEIDQLGQAVKIERAAFTNLPLKTSGPCGCVEATRTFDSRGNITSLTDRLGQVTRFEYDPVLNKITKMTDRLGRITTYRYDTQGNLTTITNPLNQTTSIIYDSFGEMTSITDRLGHTTRFEYDAFGNRTENIDALGHRSATEYDAIGRVTAASDALNRRAAFQYDSLGRLIAMTDASGAATNYGYDANGNQISVTDALNKQWLSVYDSKNRLISVTDPIGRVTRLQYDNENELTQTISPSGRTLRYGYDQRGLQVSATDPMNGVVVFAYDNRKNLTSLTDQRGNTTTFDYDELFRVISMRDPLGRSSSAKYNALGRIIEMTDRLGRTTTTTYDGLDRITRAAYADATVTFAYDAGSRLTRIDDTQGGTIQRSYDDADRMLSETTAAGIVRYSYNSADQVVSMTAADRPAVSYGYDSAGRLQNIAQGSETFTYGYDALSRAISLQRPNGVNTSYSYDAVDRLTRLMHGKPASAPIEDYRYTYDADDEIDSITSVASPSLLPQAKDTSPADAANRIAQFGQTNYAFDNNGQTTSRTDTQGTTRFDWDARGRMIRATLPNGEAISYAYDALGRRTSRAANGLMTSFLYDGNEVVLDKASDGSGVDYLYGNNVDDRLRQSGGSGSLYFLQDNLRSPIALTDASGNVSGRRSYEPFGNSPANALTRYGYTGREPDAATGLIYYRARWYDPQQGRFVSEDPIAFIAGQANLYMYVDNNPINRIDPLGLKDITISKCLDVTKKIRKALNKLKKGKEFADDVEHLYDLLTDPTKSDDETGLAILEFAVKYGASKLPFGFDTVYSELVKAGKISVEGLKDVIKKRAAKWDECVAGSNKCDV